MPMKKFAYLLLWMPLSVLAQNNNTPSKWTVNSLTEGIKTIKVNNQITLGYATGSGIKIILKDGLPFKDLNKHAV